VSFAAGPMGGGGRQRPRPPPGGSQGVPLLFPPARPATQKHDRGDPPLSTLIEDPILEERSERSLSSAGWRPSSGRDARWDAVAPSDRDALAIGALSHEDWRLSCLKQRARIGADREMVRRVADWGPQQRELVNIHCGVHRDVTYWLRDDVRSLCVFDRAEAQIRVYGCAQIERCEPVDAAIEVVARQFFLGLDSRDLRRALLVTMENSAHGKAVLQQGHLGILRAQVLLLCVDQTRARLLLAGVRILMAELLLRDMATNESSHTFHQLSTRREPDVLPEEPFTETHAAHGLGCAAALAKSEVLAASVVRSEVGAPTAGDGDAGGGAPNPMDAAVAGQHR